jgi:hypothetical protein
MSSCPLLLVSRFLRPFFVDCGFYNYVLDWWFLKAYFFSETRFLRSLVSVNLSCWLVRSIIYSCIPFWVTIWSIHMQLRRVLAIARSLWVPISAFGGVLQRISIKKVKKKLLPRWNLQIRVHRVFAVIECRTVYVMNQVRLGK